MSVLSVLTLLFFFSHLKISLHASLFAFFTEESFFCFDAFLQLLVIVCHLLSLSLFVEKTAVEISEMLLISCDLSEALCFVFSLFD